MARLTAPRASNLILPRMASLDADPPPPALAPTPGSRIAILGGCGGIGRAVHDQGVPAAGVRHKGHGRTLPGDGGVAAPADYAFHELTSFKLLIRGL